MFAVPQNNYNRNITDHRSLQQIQQWKSLKNCENCQNVTQRHKVSKCHWTKGTDRLAPCRAATHLQFVKKKCSTCTSVKWSTIKWGLSVLYWRNKNQTRILCLCLQLVIHKTIWVPRHAYISNPGRCCESAALICQQIWKTQQWPQD